MSLGIFIQAEKSIKKNFQMEFKTKHIEIWDQVQIFLITEGINY